MCQSITQRFISYTEPEDDPVKVETIRPVYTLFNVYEINRCVIDWHICVFYTRKWSSLKIQML